jgi:uncharacterized phage protein (TIGR01671 family)
MREIKFRGYVPSVKKFLILTLVADDAEVWFDGEENDKKVIGADLPNHEGWMQFTGLKDKIGKEIYESDLVLHHVKGDDEKYQYVIVWNHSGFALVKSLGDLPTSFILDKTWGDSLEVIGNIYENSELLSLTQKDHPDFGRDCPECGGYERNHKANCAAVE